MTTETPELTVEVEDTGPCSKKLKITVPQSRVEHEIEQTFKNVAKSVQFPGFRRGKAPRKMVEARLADRVLEDVKERLVQKVVEEAIGEQELQPIGDADLDYDGIKVARGADLEFEIGLDVRPVFELPELAALEVTKPGGDVTDEQVDERIEELRMERADVSDAGEEPLEEHGIARLSVTLKAGDDAIVEDEEIEWQHPSTLLGGMPIEGILEGLVGAKKDDERTFSAQLPDDFRDEAHRGAEAAVVVKVLGVDHVRAPAADQTFAESMDYDDLDEMREDLRKQLERQAEAAADRLLDDAIVNSLLDAVPFEVPPSLVKSESGRVLREHEMMLRQQGVPDEQVVQQVLAVREQAETRAKYEIRAGFVLDEIAKERKVFVTESEVHQEVASMASRYNGTVAEMQGYVERNNLDGALRSSLRKRKTLRELRDVVKLVDGGGQAASVEE